MPKPSDRLRNAWSRLRDRAAAYVKGFGRQTDEVLSGEPIDFSAPSIPYYEKLADRLSFARVILYMALLVFVVVTVVSNHTLITYENLYYLAKDIGAAALTSHAEADYVSYPISSGEADFALFRGGVAVAGCETVTVMSGSGKQTLSVSAAYAQPCVTAGEKYCITFGRGERSFAVYNSFVQVHRETTEFPVYAAAVSDSGSFAIVTRSRDYTSEVVLYDGNMERLATYRLGGYVTGISMNREGNLMGVVSAEAKGGLWETKITLIRIAGRITESSATVSGSLGSTCGFVTDSRLAVVFSDRLMILGQDATVVGETVFSEGTPALAAIGRGQVAVLTGNENDLNASFLTVYDRNAKVDYRLDMDGTHPVSRAGSPVSLAFGEGVLYLRAGDTLFRLAGSGRELSSVSVSRDTLAILPVDASTVLICTPAYAYRADEKDFSKSP